MEILNNIWTALSTENLFLTKILTIPLMFVEIYLSLYIFLYFLNLNTTKNKKIIYVITVYLFSILSNIIIPQPFSVFVNYTFILFILMKYFKLNLVQAI